MKNLYIALCFVLLTSSNFAQTKSTKKADKLFSTYEFVAAAKAYSKLVDAGDISPYVYKQLADTYFNMFNAVEANKWYAKAVETEQDSETYFRYAQMLKANGKYDESNAQMRKFASLNPGDSRSKSFLANPNYATVISEMDKSFSLKNLDVNSDTSDFGGVLYGSKFYYASARTLSRKDYGWNKEPYLDIYTSDLNPDGTFMNAQKITELNTVYHDGPVTLSADGSKIYFTSDSFRDKSFEKKDNLKLSKNNLYSADNENGKWVNIKSLPFNSKLFSTSNPSLSRDGSTLYFSSDMPGSIGGVDLWKVTVGRDGSYSEPINLGASINTEGNESFPFISEDNATLYFASSGKQGLGGLDIYQVDLSKTELPVNIGKPVNTEADDFSFSFNKEKNMGFFSSNRTGNDEIYGALPICMVNLISQVVDAKTGLPIPNAKVILIDSKKAILSSSQSNDKGETYSKVVCDEEFSLQVSKDGYSSDVFQAAKSKEKRVVVVAKLNPIEPIITDTEVILQPIYFEYNKSNITQEGAFELDKLVGVMVSNPQLVILAKSHTDSRGNDKYNLSLSESRAKSTVQYILSKGIDPLRISGKGFGELEPKITCASSVCTEDEHAQNRRSEFLIVK